jgi:hypothetical protein
MSKKEGNNNHSKLTKKEARELAEMYRYLLDAYGLFAERLGTIQQTHKEAYESMFSLDTAAKLPELMSEMAEKEPELNKLFTRIFVKMSTFLPRLGNLMNLSANDKIQLGQSLKLLAKDFDELLDWIEKAKEE